VSIESGSDRAHGLELLRQMLLIRRFEEKAAELYTVGKIRGFLHLYIGEEAIAVGVCEALRADDYVTKPFSVDELLARLRAVLRRSGPTLEPVITVGELSIDVPNRSVTRNGTRIKLSPHEFDLLRVLAQNPGKLLTHRMLLREVWGPAYQVEAHYIHVYVSNLRRKIEPDPSRPRYVLTEPGAGYRLVDTSS